MDPLINKATIRVDELIFDDTSCDWNVMPENPKRGTVVCYDVDRAPMWDMFVVIETTDTTIKAICPRIRATSVGNVWKIEIGQDKMTETFEEFRTKCKCPPISQGDDFCCHCGAYETNHANYHATFESRGTEADYEVITLKNINKNMQRYAPWLEWVKVTSVNDLDVQDGPHCCGSN